MASYLPLFALTMLVVLPHTLRAGDEPYLREYRAYAAALESGDKAVAVKHAQAAWTAAEEALGHHRLTGIFAYNYGRQILFDDPGTALRVLSRAARLHNAGIVELPVPRIKLYLRYAEFVVSGYEAREAVHLRDLLETFDSEDSDAVADVASIWHQLTLGHFAEERFGDAIDSAARAEAALMNASSGDPNRLAEVILIGGISRLLQKENTHLRQQKRSIHVALQARDEFRRARLLFPPQKDLETFDPLFAHVLAWNEAVEALLDVLRCGHVYGTCVDDEAVPAPPLFEHQDEGACEDIEWLENQRPQFPQMPLGYGAVIVGYRLGDDLKIHDARILAQEPYGWFGDDVLETMSGWRAKELPSNPACYQNLVAKFRLAAE